MSRAAVRNMKHSPEAGGASYQGCGLAGLPRAAPGELTGVCRVATDPSAQHPPGTQAGDGWWWCLETYIHSRCMQTDDLVPIAFFTWEDLNVLMHWRAC